MVTLARPKKKPSGSSKGRSKRSSLDWLDESPLVPRAGTPAVDRIDRKARRLRRAIYGALILGVFSMIGLITSASNTTSTGSSVAVSLTSPGRNVATSAVQAWLSEVPSPLPHASILSWDGATTIKGVGGKVELDTFTLSQPIPGTANSPTGQQDYYYKATIEIELNGLIPIGGPGLQPLKDAGSVSNLSSPPNPWPTVINVTNSVATPVTQAITGWLQAYTSGSSTQLAVAVGDPNSGDHYRPLYGVRSAQFLVVDAAPREAPNVAPATNNPNPNAEIVEVSLYIHWSHHSAPSVGGQNGPATTMDLLVERADSAAPIVVAWGQPGSGPFLQPYQNGHE